MVRPGILSKLLLRSLSKYSSPICATAIKGSVIHELNASVQQAGMNDSRPTGRTCGGKVIKVTAEDFIPFAELAAETLKSGGVIAIPTDTIYGLAADAQNDEAIRRIYEIKGRDSEKPISICLSRTSDFYKWADVHVPSQLLSDVLPGPVTLVFRRSEYLNRNLNPGTHLIGIRIPDYPIVQYLSSIFGGPVALTSANPSSAPSTLAPEEFKELWPSLDYIFDAGRIPVIDYNLNLPISPPTQVDADATARLGSTVIDVSDAGYFRIIRKGILCDHYIHLLTNSHNLIQKFD